jgi:hypothetical protein
MHTLMDSHWFLAYAENADKSITIHGHWRDQLPVGMSLEEFKQTEFDSFKLIEGAGRMVWSAIIGKFDKSRGEWSDERRVSVKNNLNVFAYGGPV